jgi:hypothetical protein
MRERVVETIETSQIARWSNHLGLWWNSRGASSVSSEERTPTLVRLGSQEAREKMFIRSYDNEGVDPGSSAAHYR